MVRSWSGRSSSSPAGCTCRLPPLQHSRWDFVFVSCHRLAMAVPSHALPGLRGDACMHAAAVLLEATMLCCVGSWIAMTGAFPDMVAGLLQYLAC